MSLITIPSNALGDPFTLEALSIPPPVGPLPDYGFHSVTYAASVMASNWTIARFRSTQEFRIELGDDNTGDPSLITIVLDNYDGDGFTDTFPATDLPKTYPAGQYSFEVQTDSPTFIPYQISVVHALNLDSIFGPDMYTHIPHSSGPASTAFLRCLTNTIGDTVTVFRYHLDNNCDAIFSGLQPPIDSGNVEPFTYKTIITQNEVLLQSVALVGQNAYTNFGIEPNVATPPAERPFYPTDFNVYSAQDASDLTILRAVPSVASAVNYTIRLTSLALIPSGIHIVVRRILSGVETVIADFITDGTQDTYNFSALHAVDEEAVVTVYPSAHTIAFEFLLTSADGFKSALISGCNRAGFNMGPLSPNNLVRFSGPTDGTRHVPELRVANPFASAGRFNVQYTTLASDYHPLTPVPEVFTNFLADGGEIRVVLDPQAAARVRYEIDFNQPTV